MVKVKKDLTGLVFGRLTVLKQAEDYVDSNGKHYAQWLCECSCKEHNRIIVRLTDLKRNDKRATRSCGCIQKEKVIETGHENATPMCESPDLRLNLYDAANNEFYGTCTTYNTGETYYFSMDFYDKIKDTCPRVYIDHNNRRRLSLYDKDKRRNVTLLTYIGLKGWDHINRDNPLDNRKSNLRQATGSEQCQNRNMPKNNTSGIIGVSWDKQRQKWKAHIGVNKKSLNLGLFVDKDEAIKARLNAELKYFSDGFEPQRHLFAEYGIIQTVQN